MDEDEGKLVIGVKSFLIQETLQPRRTSGGYIGLITVISSNSNQGSYSVSVVSHMFQSPFPEAFKTMENL